MLQDVAQEYSTVFDASFRQGKVFEGCFDCLFLGSMLQELGETSVLIGSQLASTRERPYFDVGI